MRGLYWIVILSVSFAWSVPNRSADAYFRDAAAQFIEGRLPTAALTCQEGLRQYPENQSLQLLLERIQENQEEQKKQCNNPQNSDNPNENQDKQENQEKKDSEDSSQKNESQDSEKSASSSESQGSSSSAQAEPNQGGSSSAGASSNSAGVPVAPGELTPEQAEQLLREFNQHRGERKPWKPGKGRARPEKDW